MTKPLWKVYSKLVKLVREDHGRAGCLVGGGHDFAHALMTAQYCLQIADEPLATLGWIAGICHNTDRFFHLEWKKAKKEFDYRMQVYLENINATIIDNGKALILEAVTNHSNKPSQNDSALTIVLMDADKLANIGSLLVIRSAQFQPTIPQVNLVHLFNYPPGCNYHNPGSILRDIESALEWEQPGWFRTPKAIELAKPLFAELRRFRDNVLRQFQDTGLLPWPWPEDFNLKTEKN